MNTVIPLIALTLVIILTAGCFSNHPLQEQESQPASAADGSIQNQMGLPPTTQILPTAPISADIQGQPVPFFPGGVYHKGDAIRFSGTTILSPGNNLLFEVTSVSFGPTSKTNDTIFYGTTSMITVQKGSQDSVNTWSYTLNTSVFEPGEYQVLISGISVKSFIKSAKFTLLP